MISSVFNKKAGLSFCRGGSALATTYTFYMFCTANNKSEI